MSTLAGQQAIIDVQTFLAWTDAVASADTKLAVFLRTRFRPEFLVAFDAWLGRPPGATVSTDEIPPGTPFDTYRPAAFAALGRAVRSRPARPSRKPRSTTSGATTTS